MSKYQFGTMAHAIGNSSLGQKISQEQARAMKADLQRRALKQAEKDKYARAVAIQKLIQARKQHKAVKPLRNEVEVLNQAIRSNQNFAK